MMPPKSATENVVKLCGCKKWKVCAHPWYFCFQQDRIRHRDNLDKLIGRHPADFVEAKTEARRAINAKLEGRDPAKLQPSDSPTLAQLMQQYSERPTAGPSAKYQVGPITATVVQGRKFGEWCALDITTQVLEGFRQQRPRSAANRNLAFLRALFNWAIADGLVPKSPFRIEHVAVVKLNREDARTRRLQGDEEARLLAACTARDPQPAPPPLRDRSPRTGKPKQRASTIAARANPYVAAVITAALETGYRWGELLSLQWHQVRFTPRAEIFLPAHKTKGKKDRRVPISGVLQRVLVGRRHDPAGKPLPPDAFVFGDEIGRRLSDASVVGPWKEVCRRAKIEGLHFHDLRREAGSRWMDAGVPLATIQRWLGHFNISQTSTYLGASTGGDEQDMRAFEVKIGRVNPLAHIGVPATTNGSEPTPSSSTMIDCAEQNAVVH